MLIEYPAAGAEPEDPPLATDELRLDEVLPRISALDVVQEALATDGSQRSDIEQRIAYHALRTRPSGVPADAVVRIAPALRRRRSTRSRSRSCSSLRARCATRSARHGRSPPPTSPFRRPEASHCCEARRSPAALTPD